MLHVIMIIATNKRGEVSMNMIAKVIVDIKHEAINQEFSYLIPNRFQTFLKKGMRVLVPFGAQMRMGFVVELVEKSDKATKEIADVLDITPTINEETFKLIDEIMLYAPNLYSSIFSTVCPSEIMMSYQKEVKLLLPEQLPEELKQSFDKKGTWKLKKKDQLYWAKLKRLAANGVISIETIISQKGVKKTEVFYGYNEDHKYLKIKNYSLVIESFLNKKTISKKELMNLGLSASSLKTLEKHQVLISSKKEVTREIKHHFTLKDKKVKLTDEQQKAKDAIVGVLNRYQTFLLKGVTGSGKTEIYLELIEGVLKKDGQVLVLVPEITLIGPMAKRLKSRFDNVVIYHSGLSKGERFDQYNLLQTNKASILLGTRSAVFLPLNQLGLIIIDEEHDMSYEQQVGVFYDAKKIAETRAIYHSIPLVLGSATPSIISMYQAEQKKYRLLELKKRPFGLELPTIQLIDMKKELKENNSSIFSKALLEAMKLRLKKGEQIILLLNRKGYSPFVLCQQCDYVPSCPHCDISLTYYKKKSLLKCHYCGYEKKYSQTCEVCKQTPVKEAGIAIEYVEQELKKVLPLARVVRMDASVTKTKGSHEIIWNDFLNQKADILLGTQMIAKGFDFPLVTLVGVLMSDLLLKVPSYRASEQAFMLLSQVTGRSGRFLPGQAIIQGYNLEHYAIRSVITGYDYFYKEALYYRKLAKYMPYQNVSQILIEGPSFLQTYQQAFLLKKHLTNKAVTVLGPTPALIKRIKDMNRFVITLKYQKIDHINLFKIIKSFETNEIRIKYYPILDVI